MPAKEKIATMPNQPKCKLCKSPATFKAGLFNFCSTDCAYEYARAQQSKQKAEKEKNQRQSDRVRKQELKSRGDWLKEAQTWFNKFIRLRDDKLPCVSCGRFHQGQWHAGHYLSVGAHPELRFNELNVWRQCQPCNAHLSGNQINYRKELVNRIGLESVESLEGPQEQTKLSIEDIKTIIATYKAKVKALSIA